MKIAVSGAHSTGKTSWLTMVGKRLELLGMSYEQVPDLALSCPLPILRKHTPASALWIVSRGISEEILAASTAAVVLVDRPVSDAWAYLMVADEGQPFDEESPLLRTLVTAIETWMPSYDIIYKTVVDPTIPIDTKRGRYGDAGYRLRVEKGIDVACRRFNIPARPLRIDNCFSEIDWIVQAIMNASVSPTH